MFEDCMPIEGVDTITHELAARIKLAEAMGWRGILRDPDDGELRGLKPHRPKNANHYIFLVPDPFTNANDDYAVLEWMRNCYRKGENQTSQGCNTWHEFAYVWLNHISDYKKGDYARAACAALDISLSSQENDK